MGVVSALAVTLGGAGEVQGHPLSQRVDVPAARSAQAPEPALLPTPQAECGPGSRPETGTQGRVSPEDHESGRAARGFTCNTELVGSYTKPNAVGTVGGFKVERYVDAAGHDCAYYDSTLMFPTNLFDLEGGVNVLDMADPLQPKLTARLVTPAMDSPHESLVLSHRRGLLAAVVGNVTTNVGIVDIYDVSADCRHPVLLSSTPVGFLGHESGMAPDGRTFYSASPSSSTLVAVDISNPSLPHPIWIGNYDSHGLSISDDGNRAYVAGVDSGLIILDVSEIQARRPLPAVREVARLQWNSMSIPQNAFPFPSRAIRTSWRSTSSAASRRWAPGASSTSPTRPSHGSSRTCGWRCTSPRTSPRRRTTPARTTPSRATRVTTATSRTDRPRDRGLHHDPVRAPGIRHPRPASPP